MWSIGIYSGDSPLNLAPHPGLRNPVLTGRDHADLETAFVADPFMVREGSDWYMFFEAQVGEENGEIALATRRRGGQWRYRQVVLAEPYHLSYPHVFPWAGEHYMIPETLGAGCIRLYRAASFPPDWTPVASLIDGAAAEPTIFRHAGRWWLFACPAPRLHETLRLFLADRLTGPWREHPLSPIVESDRRRARPAGRVTAWKGRWIRFAQDGYPHYGARVRAFEITELTPETYREHEVEESPVLTPGGRGWRRSGMHHVDAHQLQDGRWIACVDGWRDPALDRVSGSLPTASAGCS